MKVGFLGASPFGWEMDLLVAAILGVVVKTLRLDRDVAELQYGHVYSPVLPQKERKTARLLGVDGVVSH
jgi:hypothetical protein